MNAVLELVLLFSTLFGVAHCGLLLWAKTPIFLSPLKQFTDKDFEDLVQSRGRPQIIALRQKSNDIEAFDTILKSYYSAYVPKDDVHLNNVKDIQEVSQLREILKSTLDGNYIIALLMEEKSRIKRKTESENDTETSYSEPPKGPILYAGKSKEGIEAMIYSSKPPLLKIGTSSILLGPAALTTIDNRDSFTRLIATIPIENGKVTLRFKFPWVGDYWFLTSAEFVDENAKNWNLTLNQELTAQRRFSYHCGGSIVFSDPENDKQLTLYDVQVQPDGKNGRFSDAYNCIPFTTVPIWSGLLVSTILVLGLGVGLGALNSIKTMDKFDNHRTKQLSITVSE